MPKNSKYFVGIALGAKEIAMVVLDKNKKIQNTYHEPGNDALPYLISKIKQKNSVVNIGLSDSLVNFHTIFSQSSLSQKELRYCIKNSINTAKCYYTYHVHSQGILLVSSQKKIIDQIYRLCRKNKLLLQRIEPEIIALIPLLPSSPQKQTILLSQYPGFHLYSIENHAMTFYQRVEYIDQIVLTSDVLLWTDENDLNVKHSLIKSISSLATFDKKFLPAYASALRSL